MDPEAAAKTVLNGIAADIRRNTDNHIETIRTGVSPTRPHPFNPGAMLELVQSKPAKLLAAKLAAAGLNKDAEFMAALRSLLIDLTHGTMYSFFTALDGEGAFADDIQLELRLDKGEPLPRYLHEIFPHPDATKD